MVTMHLSREAFQSAGGGESGAQNKNLAWLERVRRRRKVKEHLVRLRELMTGKMNTILEIP